MLQRRLGDSWEVLDDLMGELEAFTCALYGEVLGDLMDELEAFTCALYGNQRTTNLNLLHYKKLPHCVIQLILYLKPQKASTFQTYLHA